MLRYALIASVSTFLICSACSCTSGVSETDSIDPPTGLTDQIVTPVDLSDEFQVWVEQDWQPFKLPDDIDSLSLDLRRALVYYSYSNRDREEVETRLFQLISVSSLESDFDALADTIGLRLSDTEVYHSYLSFSSRSGYLIDLEREYTLGEQAWLGDYILSSYPEMVFTMPGFKGLPASTE